MTRYAFAAALLLATAWTAPAFAVDDDPICANAPSLVVLLGNDKHSAARQPSLTNAIMREVEPVMRKLPLCSTVLVIVVGDAEAITETFKTRIYTRMTRDGMPLAVAISRVRDKIADVANHPRPVAKQNALVRGLFSGAQYLNPKSKENRIVFISSLAETEATDCTRAESCHLGTPEFSLANADLIGLGVGNGQPAALTTAIFKEWQRFFALAGIPVSLRRDF